MNLKLVLFAAFTLLLAGCSKGEWEMASIEVELEPGVYQELKIQVSSAHDLEVMVQMIEDAQKCQEVKYRDMGSEKIVPRRIGETGY